MNKKAISTLTLIILIGISAIIGGIISYMLTIAHYVEMEYNIPENKVVLTITNVYIDPEDASSFSITVLNPSFSISNTTITRIAINIGNSTELYDVVKTEPAIKGGLTVPKGKAVNITCSALQIDGKEVAWGEFAYKFAGQPIIINVFSRTASAANKEVTLPYVKLHVTPSFQPGITFKSFDIALTNDENSEANLTIQEIFLSEPEVDFTIRETPIGVLEKPKNITPSLPYPLHPGETEVFTCELNWLGINKTKILITTAEGYKIYQEVEPGKVYFTIEDVTFDKDDTEHFKVTVKNHFGSASKVTLTNIAYSLDNGTTRYVEGILPTDIPPMLSLTLTCAWNWREYRGREVTVTVYLEQGFNRSVTVTTPPPIILEMLNPEDVFELENKTYFNITLRNHQSSLEAVNITKIKVEEIVIDGTKANSSLPYLLEPGKNVTFYCDLGKSWTDYNKESLNITIEYVTNKTQITDSVTFVVPLPKKAELNITSVKRVELGTPNYLNVTYLNITIENLAYSAINLTISKIVVTLENQTLTVEMQITPGQIVIAPGEKAFMLFPIKLEEPIGEVTIKIITEEGIETSWSGTLNF